MRIGTYIVGKKLKLGDHVIAWHCPYNPSEGIQTEGVDGIVVKLDDEFVTLISVGKTFPCDVSGNLEFGITVFYTNGYFVRQVPLSIEEMLTHGSDTVRAIAKRRAIVTLSLDK